MNSTQHLLPKIVILFVAFSHSIPAQEYTGIYAEFDQLLESVRLIGQYDDDVDGEVGGIAVFDAGRPHPFYLLTQYIYFYADSRFWKTCLSDPSANVRALGALCLLTDGDVNRNDVAKLLKDDSAFLRVYANGCVGDKMTVSAFVNRLGNDDQFFKSFDPVERYR